MLQLRQLTTTKRRSSGPLGRRGNGCALLLLCVAIVPAAFAHPGNGIVMDRDGAIYYTDLKQVWKVAPDGTQQIAVPRVHTHELSLDADGNLYGEHLWYEGEARDTWGHRIWRRMPDGTVCDIVVARPGVRDDYDDIHFVRDARGNMYWADRAEIATLRRRSGDGTVTTLGKLDGVGSNTPGRMHASGASRQVRDDQIWRKGDNVHEEEGARRIHIPRCTAARRGLRPVREEYRTHAARDFAG